MYTETWIKKKARKQTRTHARTQIRTYVRFFFLFGEIFLQIDIVQFIPSMVNGRRKNDIRRKKKEHNDNV